MKHLPIRFIKAMFWFSIFVLMYLTITTIMVSFYHWKYVGIFDLLIYYIPNWCPENRMTWGVFALFFPAFATGFKI